MKKIYLMIAILFVCAFESMGAAKKPQWADPEIWRLKLKKDMSASAVRKYLGEPNLEIESSSRVVWYYQSIPEVSYKKEKCTIKWPRHGGIVEFYRRSTRKNASPTGREPLFISSWSEPDFDKITDSEPNNLPKKQQHKILKKWEDKKNWDRLVIGLTDNAVDKILGQPFKSGMTGEREDCWYYQKIPTSGCSQFDSVLFFGAVKFKDKKVEGWLCPFWPEIDK